MMYRLLRQRGYHELRQAVFYLEVKDHQDDISVFSREKHAENTSSKNTQHNPRCGEFKIKIHKLHQACFILGQLKEL